MAFVSVGSGNFVNLTAVTAIEKTMCSEATPGMKLIYTEGHQPTRCDKSRHPKPAELVSMRKEVTVCAGSAEYQQVLAFLKQI